MMSGRPSTYMANPESIDIFDVLFEKSSYLESKRDDDDLAGVAGVTDGGSRTDTQALLPLSQALIVLVCYFTYSQRPEPLRI